MRAFIVLCLVAVACADKLGYNYNPVGHSGSGLSFTPGSGSGHGGLGGLSGGGLSGGSLSGGGLSGSGLGGHGGHGGHGVHGGHGGSLGGLSGGNFGGLSGGDGSLGLSGLGSPNFGGLGGDSGFDAPVSYNGAPSSELDKEFFTFTANEEDFDEPQALERVASSVNKGLRVVFIKGPENRGLENAALALAKQAAQQETAIYVLNKQTDIGDLASKLNAIGANKNNKPEVHFVKYRTPEDAANAQKAIQSQYDSLGGSSQSHNGGVANALNFASASQVRQPNAHTPDNSYLPSSVLRRLRFRY